MVNFHIGKAADRRKESLEKEEAPYQGVGSTAQDVGCSQGLGFGVFAIWRVGVCVL